MRVLSLFLFLKDSTKYEELDYCDETRFVMVFSLPLLVVFSAILGYNLLGILVCCSRTCSSYALQGKRRRQKSKALLTREHFSNHLHGQETTWKYLFCVASPPRLSTPHTVKRAT